MVNVNFEFASAGRIIFGPGVIKKVGGLASLWGRRGMIVSGRSVNKSQPILEFLAEAQVAVTLFSITEEPTLARVLEGIQIVRQEKCDFVIGFGGGSALDAGKAIAALATNPGDMLDYLEVVGKGRELIHPPLPYLAIPTTAGTGSEVTRNAVLSLPEDSLKVSLRSPMMLPKIALVDPELTYTLPPDITASTGLDALTQLVEPYVSNRANPLTDGFCLSGIQKVAQSLFRAYRVGNDIQARSDMSLAALLGGLALANAKLGAVHGFAAPIGGMFAAPHGIVCACLLPYVVDANLRALRDRSPESPIIARYREIAAILTGNILAEAEETSRSIHIMCGDLHIPKLSAYGVREQDFPCIIKSAYQSSSMQGNPIKLEPEEMQWILEQAL